jgi:hypothetical protein
VAGKPWIHHQFFAFAGRWLSALPAADFAALLNRASRSTLLALRPAFRRVAMVITSSRCDN